LVADGCYVVLSQLIGDGGHEGVIHSGTCTVREYEKTCGASGQQEESGNFLVIENGKSQIANVVRCGVHCGSLCGFI
jgi:hypothetical protein